MKKIILAIVVIVVVGLIAYFGLIRPFRATQTTGQQATKQETKAETSEYNPTVDPENFVSFINNPHYSLVPGKTFTYQGKTKEGTEKNIMMVTDKTKDILGVRTIEVWDRVWLNDDLVEETFDWYAQDKDGNMWYLGEDSKEYENGKITGTKGSWQAGVNGAKPGIIMKANPKVGNSYRQEYFKGEAEDMADIVALGETVTVSLGKYTNCLKTRDWSKIDPKLNEYKYYSPDVGNMVLEVVVGSGERTELVNMSP